MENKKNGLVGKIFSYGGSYFGAVVGAGFASGQEVMQFYTNYGVMSMVAIIVAMVIFIWIGYDGGHTWIVVGQCSDKSAVIVHSTPQAGCQLAGTTTPDGNYDSQAVALAKKYMSRYAGYSKYEYHPSCGNYIRRGNYLRWNTKTLSDPDGFKKMTADQILKVLFP